MRTKEMLIRLPHWINYGCISYFQEKSSVEIEQNHRAHLNPDQPLISSLEITEKEIKEQEERVNQARVKLARAVKALGWNKMITACPKVCFNCIYWSMCTCCFVYNATIYLYDWKPIEFLAYLLCVSSISSRWIYNLRTDFASIYIPCTLRKIILTSSLIAIARTESIHLH